MLHAPTNVLIDSPLQLCRQSVLNHFVALLKYQLEEECCSWPECSDEWTVVWYTVGCASVVTAHEEQAKPIYTGLSMGVEHVPTLPNESLPGMCCNLCDGGDL